MRRIKRALKRVLVFGIRNPRRKPREASNLQGATSGALRGGAVAGTKALCCARCCPHTKAPHRDDCSAERFALCGAGTTFPCTVLMAASPARDAYRSSGQRIQKPHAGMYGSKPCARLLFTRLCTWMPASGQGCPAASASGQSFAADA